MGGGVPSGRPVCAPDIGDLPQLAQVPGQILPQTGRVTGPGGARNHQPVLLRRLRPQGHRLGGAVVNLTQAYKPLVEQLIDLLVRLQLPDLGNQRQQILVPVLLSQQEHRMGVLHVPPDLAQPFQPLRLRDWLGLQDRLIWGWRGLSPGLASDQRQHQTHRQNGGQQPGPSRFSRCIHIILPFHSSWACAM